jgi:hypothetical protein
VTDQSYHTTSTLFCQDRFRVDAGLWAARFSAEYNEFVKGTNEERAAGLWIARFSAEYSEFEKGTNEEVRRSIG